MMNNDHPPTPIFEKMVTRTQKGYFTQHTLRGKLGVFFGAITDLNRGRGWPEVLGVLLSDREFLEPEAAKRIRNIQAI